MMGGEGRKTAQAYAAVQRAASGEGVDYAWAEVGVSQDTPTEALWESLGGEHSYTHFSSWLKW